MQIELTSDFHHPHWLALRREFIPELTLEEHQCFLSRQAGNQQPYTAFIAYIDSQPVGFAEVSRRTEYVNGCLNTGAVLYLEGMFVQPHFRKQGVMQRVLKLVEKWGLQQGCREFASDSLLEDLSAQESHCKLGFTETERVVFYRKALTEQNNHLKTT